MKPFFFALLSIWPVAGSLHAQSVVTEPIGFNKVTCLANSDTVVGVPLRKEGSQSTTLSGDPVVTGDSATLAVTASFTAGQFSTQYVKFNGGTKDGFWYDITANGTDSITIDLNGDNLTGVVAGNSMIIAEYWTLGSLFDPALSTTDPTTTGNAIVATTGTLLFQRRTEVLLPDLVQTGVNRASAAKYFIYSGEWRLNGDATNTKQDDVILYPDSYFIVRHPATVTANTTFRSLGEVETNNWTIALATLTTGQQDTYISLFRPLPVTLTELNLWESGAFVASTGTLLFQRRDVLLVFDNATPGPNKAASATYYHNGTNWLKNGTGTTPHDSTAIPAGAGFIVRKYMTATGVSSFWKNIPSY